MAPAVSKDMEQLEPPTMPTRIQTSTAIFLCLRKVLYCESHTWGVTQKSRSCVVPRKTEDIYPPTLGLNCPQRLPSQWTGSKSANIHSLANKAQVWLTMEHRWAMPGKIQWKKSGMPFIGSPRKRQNHYDRANGPLSQLWGGLNGYASSVRTQNKP